MCNVHNILLLVEKSFRLHWTLSKQDRSANKASDKAMNIMYRGHYEKTFVCLYKAVLGILFDASYANIFIFFGFVQWNL